MKSYLKATLYEPECVIKANILFLGLLDARDFFKNNLLNIKATIYLGKEHYTFQAFPHIFSSDTNGSEM